ncbi:hypothetical protein D046_4896B, partial [Vibrio parahaemolyticus V-223/04]
PRNNGGLSCQASSKTFRKK